MIEHALDQYDKCRDWQSGCEENIAAMNNEEKEYPLTAEEISEIKYVLTKPALRELYDKTESFIRKPIEQTHTPSQGTRFLTAFGEGAHFSMFCFMLFLFVEKHQNFAKQMTISSLLCFASACI